MSTALAIAAVTAVLKNLLDDGLIDDHVTSTVGHVNVTALAPDLIPLEKDATSQLNLFLYQVTPNAGWRNVGLPSRDAEGERRTNPPLALDLHYLLTAYASRDLHAEILLGYGMQLLHETPMLARAAIRRALSVPGLVADSPDSLPPQLEELGASGLAEQVETIKITPETMGTEELSKLWSAFQSRYRPSTGYRVSVVLIEADRSTRVPLPVRARRLFATLFREPFVERLLVQETAGGPIVAGRPILARHRLAILGRDLAGPLTTVRIGSVTVTPDPAELTDARIVVPLPAGLAAGIQSVQVVHEQLLGDPPVPHAGVASNLVAFVLHPEIVAPISSPAPGVLRVTVTPAVEPSQHAVLLLNELVPVTSPPLGSRPRAYSFAARRPAIGSPTGPTADLDVPIRGVAPGTYLARIAVDGAESPLGTDISGAYASPTVTIT